MPSSTSSTSSPTPSPAPAPVSRWQAARYRVWQFGRSLLPRPLDASDRAILDAHLPTAAQAVFTSMSRNDQRHSLTVYHALQERGCADPDMLAAALLHDSGKGGGRVRLWVRPPFVLLRWLARDDAAWWRRPFYYAWRHADVGADLAAAAGLSVRAVLLIRTHHQPNGPAAELHAVDDAL